jgi:hypothetical protein
VFFGSQCSSPNGAAFGACGASAQRTKKKTSEAEKDQEPLNDAFSDDSDDDQAYTSSDEEGEVYVRGKLGKRRKVAAREELPRGREPVTNPLTWRKGYGVRKLACQTGSKRARTTSE